MADNGTGDGVKDVLDELVEDNFPVNNQNNHGYYFEDTSTYPHAELRRNNPRTVHVLKTWMTESYYKNSEVDDHVCDDRELDDVSKCITLIIGNRLYELVSMLERLTPKSKGNASMMNTITSWFGMNTEPEEIKTDAKGIIKEIFGKLIFGFNNTNPRDIVNTYNGCPENNTPYAIMIKICRRRTLAMRRMNVNLWIDLPHINLDGLSPNSIDDLVEMLTPALIGDGLINSSDLGILLTKSANKT